MSAWTKTDKLSDDAVMAFAAELRELAKKYEVTS